MMWANPRMGMNVGRGGVRPIGPMGFQQQRGQVFFNQTQHHHQPMQQQRPIGMMTGQRMRMPVNQQPQYIAEVDVQEQMLGHDDGMNVDEDMKPVDDVETQKLTVLQMQAQHWKSTKEQWEHQQNLAEKMDYAKTVTQDMFSALLNEERDFEKQYSDWRQQFNDWQEQNKNHPNQQQYIQYANQWKDYETQMEEKKSDLVARKAKLQEALQLKESMMRSGPMGPQVTGPRHPSTSQMGPVMINSNTNMRPIYSGGQNNMGSSVGTDFTRTAPRNMGPRFLGPNPNQFHNNQNSNNVPNSMNANIMGPNNIGRGANMSRGRMVNPGGFMDPNVGQSGAVYNSHRGNFVSSRGNRGGGFAGDRGGRNAGMSAFFGSGSEMGEESVNEEMAADDQSFTEDVFEPTDSGDFSGIASSLGGPIRGGGPVRGGPSRGRGGFVPSRPIASDELPPGTEPETIDEDSALDEESSGQKTETPGKSMVTVATHSETEAVLKSDIPEEVEVSNQQVEGNEDKGVEENEETVEQEENKEEDAELAKKSGRLGTWSTQLVAKIKEEEEKRIASDMKRNEEEDKKTKDEKLEQQRVYEAERDRRLAFQRAAETLRMIQEQQERIEQIKQIQEMTKQVEKENEDAAKKEEEDKEKERLRNEKRKADIEKKLAERKSSQLQQQIEKALDKASGKATEDSKDPKDDKKITIKVNLAKDNEKKEEAPSDDNKNKVDKETDKEKRKSPPRRHSRSPQRRRSRSPYKRRSRSPGWRDSRSPGRRGRRTSPRRSRSPRRRRSRSPRHRSRSLRRSRSPRPRTDLFGRSLEMRSAEKARAEERAREERRPRSVSITRQAESGVREATKRDGADFRASVPARPIGPKPSLVPYDDDAEDDRSARDAYTRDPYASRRDPYRDEALRRDPEFDSSYRDPYHDALPSRERYPDAYSDPYRRDQARDPYRSDPYRDDVVKDVYADRLRDPVHKPLIRDPVREPPVRDPTPLYNRNPIDDSIRRLVYSSSPAMELYPELRYNRRETTYGDDEEEQAVFDYCHGKSKLVDDPYSDPRDEIYGSGERSKPTLNTNVSYDYESRSRENETNRFSAGVQSPVDHRDMYSHSDVYGRQQRPPDRDDSPTSRDLGLRPPPPPPPPEPQEEKCENLSIDDLLMSPGRERRAPKIVIIVRGLPGSGKTFISKLIRERETSCGGAPPRMLCLDDYFMVETEKMVRDPESGKMALQKVMDYEYEGFMENSYRVSMLKSFKKTIDDGYFPFIIVDAVNNKIKQFEEFWSYANSKGFQVYVAELETDAPVCARRNIHNRSLKDVQDLMKGWEMLPPMFARVDIRPLLQDAAIDDVEMEDQQDIPSPPEEEEEEEEEAGEDADTDTPSGYQKSKWELDASERKLDKLDGLSKRQRHLTEAEKFEEYLQLPDDYDMRQNTLEPGCKRVRWADIEEKKDQQRQRNLGFVVGHTNWDKIVDDNYADRALNRTKYF